MAHKAPWIMPNVYLLFRSISRVRLSNTNVINNFTIPVGCAPRTHHLIGVIGVTPYKVVKELNAFVLA